MKTPEIREEKMSALLTAVKTELTTTAQVGLTNQHAPTKQMNRTTANLAGYLDEEKSEHIIINNNEESTQIPVITRTASTKTTAEKDISGHDVDNKKKPYGGRPLRFQCPQCERRFHAPSHLKRHMLCHSSERPFQCRICKKGFLQAWHLGRHMTTHTGNKPFNCPECPKSFGSRFEMKTHCNYIHRGIKEHECKVCKKMFTLRSNLKVHMRKHTGEKPYECQICFKKFGQRGHLQYHVRKHSNASERSSKIRRSSNSFSEQTSPTMVEYRRSGEESNHGSYDSGVEVESLSSERSSPKHQESFDSIPSPLQSDMYRKEIMQETNTTPLSGRLFDHTNPLELKPFVCDSCNCGFAEISSLRAHVRHSHPKKGIVTGVYSCAYCNQSFEEIDCLREHFQRQHASGSNDEKPRQPLMSFRSFSGEKRCMDYDDELYIPVKRVRSAGIVRPMPMHSPGALSTSSDITYDRCNSSKDYPECTIPDCNCSKRPGEKLPDRYLTEVVQERYLHYLEQYQRLLESRVNLMEALHRR